MGGTGAAAVVAGLFLFLVPQRAIDVWPWHLTPLTSLILVAAARDHADFDTSNALTWLLLVGFLAALVSAAVLSVAMNAREGRERPPRNSSEVAG